MDKYKLCRVYSSGSSTVKEVSEDGSDGKVLCEYRPDETDIYYAVYENLGTHEEPDWVEWGYYEDDFHKAIEAYNKLIKEEGDK